MSIVNWSDLPETVEEFVQKYGDVPTVLSGQEQQAVEALRIKAKENNDWQPLYEQVRASIDDVESTSDDASSISSSDTSSDGDYDQVMAFNKLVAKKPSESLFKRLNQCFTDDIVCSSDAHLERYIKMGSFILGESNDVQSAFVDNLTTIMDAVRQGYQDDLDSVTVAKAAICISKISSNRIKKLEKENRKLKKRQLDGDDEPIVKRVAFKNEIFFV